MGSSQCGYRHFDLDATAKKQFLGIEPVNACACERGFIHQG